MKKYILIAALLTVPTINADEFNIQSYLNKTYVTIGIGYKFDELRIHFINQNTGEKYNWRDPYSARIEIGYNLTNNVKFGISHHSQWATGFPFNGQKNEYYKTELFVDFTFKLSDIF